jgi:hypothetical protein
MLLAPRETEAGAASSRNANLPRPKDSEIQSVCPVTVTGDGYDSGLNLILFQVVFLLASSVTAKNLI